MMKTWRCSFQSYLGLQKKQKGNKPNAININDNVLACIWSSRDIVQRKIPCPHWVYTLMGQTNKNMCQVVITSTKNKWSKENDWAYKWWSQTLNSGHENYVLPTFLFCFVILYQSQCYTKLPQSRPRKVIQICCSKLSHEEQGRKSYYRRYEGDRISGPQGVSRVGVFVKPWERVVCNQLTGQGWGSEGGFPSASSLISECGWDQDHGPTST